MTTTYPRCVHPGCFRTVTDFHRCWLHTIPEPTHSAEYEAVRLDPTTDRDRWDVWDDGGLEQPGGNDEWD